MNARSAFLTCLPLLLAACGDKQEKMGKGFLLPAGDAGRGKQAFAELECIRCHDVVGAGLAKPFEKSAVHFNLGGEVRKVKTYGELVTAITQPQHVISADHLATLEKEQRDGAVSPMPEFNNAMTVRQLSDIVTFLHGHYSQVVPEELENPYYYGH